MTVRVRDVDHGTASLLERLKGASRVRVGIFSTEDVHGITLASLAAIHEFGAPAAGIPQRSFIRATVDEHATEIRDAIRGQARLIFAGKATQAEALQRIGAFVVGLIQKRIAARIPPPNAPRTIAAKGSDVPLVDTGVLRAAVTYVVGGYTHGGGGGER